MRRFFSVPRYSFAGDVALLLLRLVVGTAFMMHGFGKIQNPFGWMGADAGTPGIFQALAAGSEYFGGLAFIIGLLTPLAALGVLSTMSVALFTHVVVKGDPFVGKGGSWELPATYWCVALLLVTMGPGALSLDRKVFGAR
jgi:putative oxidoreductase